ncbi:MAG: serine hydrolase domain-containing protein [Thermodesulfobacteriota bacterium]
MPDKADTTTERLESLLRDLTSRKPVSQAVVAVETGDRSFRWVGTDGVTASGGRLAENTPFFIASIDKLYNATVTMMLNEAGLLDLDEPVSTYLPASITCGLHRHRGHDLSGMITVRHLLTHTSGLADWLEDDPKGGPSLIERILKEGDRALAIEELAAYVRDSLRPHFPPQDLTGKRPKARYSDTNFMLVMAVIEAVTGQPLHEVHRKMLYEPLGLPQTYFPGLSRPVQPTTDPMPLRASGEPLDIPLLIESVRGIYSTAADLIRFLRGLMSGEVFRNPETLGAMQGSWHRFGFPLDRAALRSPGWPIEYGIGLMRFRLPRVLTPTAPMPPVLGHTGSTGCWLFYCPELDAFLAGSVDEVTAGSVPFRTIPRILRILRTSEWATRR